MKLESRPDALSLDALSDDALLQRLGELARRQHALTAVLLAHIAEVDRRRLYLREACSSMHRYCVERLGLSDGAAYKRIRAARAARRFPLIFEMVERGELHLKGVTLVAAHLCDSNHREVLARAKGQSVRAIEKLVAELAPRPDVQSRVRAIPSRSSARPLASAQSSAVEPPPAPKQPTTSEEPASARAFAPPVAFASPLASKRPVVPLAPRRYELRITIDEAVHADLEQLRDLLAHQIPDRDPATIVGRALELLLERTLARKAAVTAGRDSRRDDRPRRSSADAGGGGPHAGNSRSRHIPAQVRRAVWSRDGGRCSFLDAAGRRCTGKSALEFHHVDNWARGADHDPDRLELRCRAHNQYQAVLDYGEATIEIAREARGSRNPGARESVAAYRLRPAGICG